MGKKPLKKLEDAGGARKFTARWVIMGEVVLETATHFGCEEGEGTDMEILRDEREGLPLLPGSSLAGALRSYLADVLYGYFQAEPNRDDEGCQSPSEECRKIALLFGGFRGDRLGSQSPLIVFDSLGELPAECSVEIRDGVAIDPMTGTAEAHKKFDFELLPAGTVFPVRFDLLVDEGKDESLLLSLLVAALEGLSDGEISLGMRRSRGLGRIRAGKWQVRRYDLTDREGWLDWLNADPLKPFAVVDHRDSLREAVAEEWNSWEEVSLEDQRQRHRMVVELDLDLRGDLLVRSPASEADAPDVVHLRSGGEPVLPGTGLAGALRAQALRIARLVRNGDGDKWVESIFGPRVEGKRSTDFQPRASRLLVSESVVEEARDRCQTRIAVDRFTGGVVEGALFEEEVLGAGKLEVRLELRNPSDAEMGLLLLLVRDLLAGEITVGGGASVGRGALAGRAEILFPGDERLKVKVSRNLHVGENESLLDEKIRAFHEEEFDGRG